MFDHPYSYDAILAASEKIHWRVEDLIGDDKPLDFGRPFLPETLARVQSLPWLSAAEQRALNHVRGHTYLYIFGLVEEFILPFVLDHARTHLHSDDYRVRALLQFAAEEAKHIHLFRRFSAEFERGFGFSCGKVGPPREIARAVLSHHPLGVALAILQIEWMTQAHYLESVKDDQDLAPQFKSLLRHHWMEEAQHAKIDTIVIDTLADACTPEEIDRAVDDYGKIGALLDGGLTTQAEFDVDSFVRRSGRTFTADEREALRAVQRQATRWTFLGSGMSHRNFLSTIGALRPAAREAVEQMVPTFS